MIVVDSSAFIEYYRPGGDPETSSAVAEAISEDQVAVNGLIQAEIVSYAASEAARERLISDFAAFHWLDLNQADFALAHDLGFQLRQTGVTIPATDLIIAASAINYDAVLYHRDRHFDLMARSVPLAVQSFL